MANLAPQPYDSSIAERLLRHNAMLAFVRTSKLISDAILHDPANATIALRLRAVAKQVDSGTLASTLTPQMVKHTQEALDKIGSKPKGLDLGIEVEQLSSALKVLSVAPLHPALANVKIDETRDEFLRNAPAVIEALRQRGKGQEATQLETATKVIGAAVGTQQQKFGEELKGESVSNVLKNIWDVIEKDPELKKLPAAQNLRRAGDKLEGAGLLDITVRNGVVVSFASNFANNYKEARQATVPTPAPAKVAQPLHTVAAAVKGMFNSLTSKPAPAAAVPAPNQAPEGNTLKPIVNPLAPSPAVEAKVESLLSPMALSRARALAEQGPGLTPVLPLVPFSKDDLPTATLAKMGLPVAELERTGQLAKLLAGQRTDLISSFNLRDAAGEQIPFAAKLVMQRDAAGVASLQFDLPKQSLEIPQQIQGREITPAMKEQLQKTGVVLADGLRDTLTGQPFTAYIAVDKELRKVVALREGAVTVPQLMHGKELTPVQQKDLIEGRPVRLEGMTHPTDSKQRFDATMQLNPFIKKFEAHDRKIYDAPVQEVKTAMKEEPKWEQQASRPKMSM